MFTGVRIAILMLAGIVALTGAADPTGRAYARAAPHTFRTAADAAAATLERTFYRPPGRWNMCVPDNCGSAVRDWGADSLVYVLYLRWHISHDTRTLPLMNVLAEAAPDSRPCRRPSCTMWSDIPMWDAIAEAREFEVTATPAALAKARRAFDVVDRSDAFALGACPSIDYQRPSGGATGLKTLETDSNYIKAALLLHGLTRDHAYLVKAAAKYAAVRRYFLDPAVALYSVYVFDNGHDCRQLSKRFFASVNGNMIDNGIALAKQTGERSYLRDATETARAVSRYLSDASGIYTNLQADNDTAEPLIEAMYDIATQQQQTFARHWLLAAAAAAAPSTSGGYGRFFNGPAPAGPISAWSSSGGLALAIVAGALEPNETIAAPGYWYAQRFVRKPITSTPASITFSGRAIALIGTIGEVCCESGHVRVFIDGSETFNKTGIWQNKSPASRSLPNSVLLSWRWPHSGQHTIAFEPGIPNAKEGRSFVHIAGYDIVR